MKQRVVSALRALRAWNLRAAGACRVLHFGSSVVDAASAGDVDVAIVAPPGGAGDLLRRLRPFAGRTVLLERLVDYGGGGVSSHRRLPLHVLITDEAELSQPFLPIVSSAAAGVDISAAVLS